MAVKGTSMNEVSGGRCPVCKKPSAHAFRPFCSNRCRDVDLARWLGGGYVITGSNAAADEDAAEAVPAIPQNARNDAAEDLD